MIKRRGIECFLNFLDGVPIYFTIWDDLHTKLIDKYLAAN
jgi:hypothetical protein